MGNYEKNAKKFSEYWKDKGYEKGETSRFWIDLLQSVYRVENATHYLIFEEQVKSKTTNYIDGFIPETKVMIEQKSSNKDLTKQIKQSDNEMLTAYQQAKRYANELPYSKKPRWIIVSNFKEFHIHDMENPHDEPEIILLENLDKEYHRMMFLVDEKNINIQKEKEVSLKAGELVGVLYEALLKQYDNPESEETLKNLNILCVRLVFCLYAEDAGIFGRKNMFHDYLDKYRTSNFREALIRLFKILNQKVDKRDKYGEEELAEFPYVNGGLFADDKVIIPRFTDEIISIILDKASADFDWSNISPTIFGGVFESTLNPETRRTGGMHYTSIENIHKVIAPLFMEELEEEFEKIKNIKVLKTRDKNLREFQEKLSKINFLDPACGSGNFLTETYISLRRLENRIIKILEKNQMIIGDVHNPVRVSIGQFYGIEINDFAVTVAKTALWIAESQMLKETQEIIQNDLDFLPLVSYSNIIEGNALRMDWNEVVSKEKVNYIMGNPPFLGKKEQDENQKEDMRISVPIKKLKQLDYVACWYFKTAKYIEETEIEAAFVSSNSIVQGEQALTIWKPLFEKNKIFINFAIRTFNWSSESANKANVHCVIIGFSKISKKNKFIYENNRKISCDNINQYLLPTQNIFIEKIGIPLFSNEKMTKGAQLIDGGNFIVGDESEYLKVIKNNEEIIPYIKKYYNSQNLINQNKTVYVLYLENCPPKILNNKYIKSKIEAVYKFRSENSSPSTNVLKNKPANYFQSQVPENKSIVIPVVSSINRKYIPICFMPENVVYTNALFFIDNATIYNFGILNSILHMEWVKVTCGRLKSDYRYSNTMGYNNFPFPELTKKQKEKIEKTAQGILDARNLYPDSSLADLYNELTMPQELRKAHQENDKAVMEAYGFNHKITESECVAELFKLYEKLVKNQK